MVENSIQDSFFIPDELLDDIQKNIEHIITTFDVPDEDKMEVIRQINYMYSRTKYLSLTDELTQLPNRRCFDNDFRKEFLRTQRYNNKLTLVMFDIDFFKNINDTYGHACGDYVLKQISNSALQTFRKTDTVYRTGGEEFMVILTETDVNQAIIPLERFRKTIETLDLKYDDNDINITVSIGASEYNSNISSIEEIINMTDQALYNAKNNGRNQCVIHNCQ